MPGSGILNVRQWRRRLLKGAKMDGITPREVAAELQKNAAAAHRLVEEVRPAEGKNKELRLTLGDADAMADLGEYYAEKILAACDLALFDRDGNAEKQGGGGPASRGRPGSLEGLCGRNDESIQTPAFRPSQLGCGSECPDRLGR